MKRFAMLMLVAMFLVVGCGKGAKACAKCGEGKPCTCKVAPSAAKTDCAKCGIGKACACPAPAAKTDCAKCGIGKVCACPA